MTRSETTKTEHKRREVLYIYMTLTDNALINIDGLEIYQTDIDILTEDYITSLSDPSMIYKSPVFKGLLLYIYNNKLKHIIETDKHNRNTKHHNFKLLDSIFFNIYLPLVYKYGFTPTVLEYTCFVNVSNQHISDIKHGLYMGNGSKVNPDHTEIVKRWYSVCESGLASKAIESNGIGAIFVLKSRYQWQESPQQVEVINTNQNSTPQQIAERFRNAEKPRLLAENDN